MFDLRAYTRNSSVDQAEAKPPESRKHSRVTLGLFIILLISILVIPIVVSWYGQRVETLKRWDTQFRQCQVLKFHLDKIGELLNTSLQTDQTSQKWFRAELHYTSIALYELRWLDRENESQLLKIANMILTLDDNEPYLMNLNSTAKSSVAKSLFNISNKALNAYSNFLNYTHSTVGIGPPFWYSGPSPPDETLLEEAVQLANEIKVAVTQ